MTPHPRNRRRSAIGLLALIILASSAPGQTETIRVHLKLCTGGAIDGLVVDHTDHGIVVVHDRTPYVFAWSEVESGSAVVAMRGLRAFQRGGREQLTAEDHFELGRYALSRSRADLAATQFRKASKLNPEYAGIVRQVLADYQRERASEELTSHSLLDDDGEVETSVEVAPGLSERLEVELGENHPSASPAVQPPSPEVRTRVEEVYRTFGETVRQVISKNIVLLETDHFLIWTDWEKAGRARLAEWCEAMYTALSRQFDLDPKETIFLAKCPVFCFRSKARFLRFARRFDGYDGVDAVGYTRSIEKSGHVHLVLLRRGHSREDYDRFACTLVHEGTHAFLHRLHTTRLIPHWVNEGCAELMAHKVLGSRCPVAANADLLARQYVRYDWPIRSLLHNVGPIDIHEYPLAYSVVGYLESLDSKQLAAFIKGLKEGQTVGAALATHYNGMTLDYLEARWRAAIRATDIRSEPSDVPEW